MLASRKLKFDLFPVTIHSGSFSSRYIYISYHINFALMAIFSLKIFMKTLPHGLQAARLGLIEV